MNISNAGDFNDELKNVRQSNKTISESGTSVVFLVCFCLHNVVCNTSDTIRREIVEKVAWV